LFPSTVQAQYGAPPAPSSGPSLNDQAENAEKKSLLTANGNPPFHLKISITEPGNPQSARHAEIEESWLSPTKYRRTIQSPDFSQTLIVNGDAVSETNTGDYYPYWLHELVTAIFDPLPIAAEIKRLPATPPPATINSKEKICREVHFPVDHWMICFNTKEQTFESVETREFNAHFSDYQKFGKKLIARRVATELEPKNEIVAQITALDPLAQPDEALFAVPTPTSPAARINFLQISEASLRKLATSSTDIAWPAVPSGKVSGNCVAFVSADRAGAIREVFPAGCDNPALEAPLRDALLQWKLQKAVVNGAPVQVQSLMAFPFTTHTP
jgi:hypothetical protein